MIKHDNRKLFIPSPVRGNGVKPKRIGSVENGRINQNKRLEPKCQKS